MIACVFVCVKFSFRAREHDHPRARVHGLLFILFIFHAESIILNDRYPVTFTHCTHRTGDHETFQIANEFFVSLCAFTQPVFLLFFKKKTPPHREFHAITSSIFPIGRLLCVSSSLFPFLFYFSCFSLLFSPPFFPFSFSSRSSSSCSSSCSSSIFLSKLVLTVCRYIHEIAPET